MIAELTLHFVKPYITPFSGIDPVPKNESSFEEWRIEIQSLIEFGEYRDYEVAQMIRNSLKLPVKKAVFTLGSSAASKDIIEKASTLATVLVESVCSQNFIHQHRSPTKCNHVGYAASTDSAERHRKGTDRSRKER